MAFSSSADLAAALADMRLLGEAVDVVSGVTTVSGIHIQVTDDMRANDVTLEHVRHLVLIKAGAISPAIGAAITVGGVGYKVREIRPWEDDGAMSALVVV